jgi:glycosyltransferase involved in cell wall biosynthesis
VRVADRRPTVLTLVDYYLPGYRAGGPVRTVANVVERLGAEFHFRIVTRDHDLGETRPYPGVPTDGWLADGGSERQYLSARRLTWRGMYALLRTTSHDLLYLNSLFSYPFTFRALVWRRFGARRGIPVVLAPRGELAPGALALGARKKRAYLWVGRRLGLFRDVTWQASSTHERDDIERMLPMLGLRTAAVLVAPDLPPPPGPSLPPKQPKSAGSLRLIFVARVARMKNLSGALEALIGVTGNVSFDIYGPMEDAAYWAECQAIIAQLPPTLRITYQGVVPPDGAREALAAHDVLLQPSLGENYGHAIVEAWSAGCPVVISDRTPWRGLEAIRAGMDVPIHGAHALRAAIERFRDMDPATFADWVAASRDHAMRLMADDDTVRRMRTLLLSVRIRSERGVPRV